MPIDLSQYEGDEYLPVGVHDVKVDNIESITNPSYGTKGIEISVKDDLGRMGKITIWTTKRGGHEDNLWTLAKFARRCGLSDDQLRRFDRSMLKGRKLTVVCEEEQAKNGRSYAQIGDRWYELGKAPTARVEPVDERPSYVAPPVSEGQYEESHTEPHNDLPF